jgi:hypothetical protein
MKKRPFLVVLLGMLVVGLIVGCNGSDDDEDEDEDTNDTEPTTTVDYGIYAGTWTGENTTVVVDDNGRYTCTIVNSFFPAGDPNNNNGVTTRSSTLKDNRFWIEAQDGTGYDVVFTSVNSGYVRYTGNGWQATLTNNH